jgi:hypothetical protein
MAQKDKNNQINSKGQRIKNPLSKRLYTIKEASEYLGRGVWGVRDLIWKGILPVVKNEGNGKKLFLDVFDLNDFIDRNKSIYH